MACAWASALAAHVSAATGSTGPSRIHSAVSSGRTPASTTLTSRSSRPARAVAIRRSASLLPASEPPVIVTREPRPIGVSHSIARNVGSSPSSAKR